MTYSTHLFRHLRFTIGQNIHALRVKRKLPLGKLAGLTHIPDWLLDQYEMGKHDITLNELLRIACALRVQMHMLVTPLRTP